jgi:hypothetical protein
MLISPFIFPSSPLPCPLRIAATRYTGGFLLLLAALPVSFIVAVGGLLLWLVLVKR